MSDAFFQVGLTAESMRVIDQWQSAPEKVAAAITSALTEFLVLVENWVKVQYLTSQGAAREGGVNLRTGTLRQAISHELTSAFEGHVGTTKGPASAYARAMLGPDSTIIRPKNAKYLWVPIADNAPPKKMNPISPTQLMEKKLPNGQRAAVIFRSKAGNLVAFLREGGNYTRGEKKGKQRGKLMFVLKKEVTLKGNDTLRRAFADKADDGTRIINEKLIAVFPG